MTGMAATQNGTAPSHKQTTIRLRVDLFDRLMAKQGITSVRGQARAVGVGKTTMFRLRAGNGCGTNTKVAMRMAEACGTTVEKLFERVEAA